MGGFACLARRCMSQRAVQGARTLANIRLIITQISYTTVVFIITVQLRDLSVYGY